jgi:hypothetical protein
MKINKTLEEILKLLNKKDLKESNEGILNFIKEVLKTKEFKKKDNITLLYFEMVFYFSKNLSHQNV